MKEGISKSLSVIGTSLIVISIGYAFNNSLSWRQYQEIGLSFDLKFGAGIVISSLILFLSYFLNFKKKWNYLSVIGVSYFLSYFLISIALNLYKGLMYPFQLSNLENVVGDVPPDQLFSITLSHSNQYQQILGYSLILASALLCFRNTRNIGALLSTFILTNIVIISYTYNYPSAPYATFLLCSSAFILLNNYKFFSAQIFNTKIKSRNYPLFKAGRLYKSLSILKMLCFVGVIVYFHFKKEDSWIRKQYLHENPIVGVWKIDEIVSENPDTSQTKEFLESEALYFEKGRSGYLKHQDSLSMFKYHLNESDRQFDLYDFHQFREIDMKGKYELINQDTMVFEGKNNKEALKIRLIRDPKYNRFLEK